MQQLGTHIQQIRKIRKMSLTELAQSSGVQIATLSRIENGKMTGTLGSHMNIAKALGVDITEIYQGLQENAPAPIKAEETLEAISSVNDKSSTPGPNSRAIRLIVSSTRVADLEPS